VIVSVAAEVAAPPPSVAVFTAPTDAMVRKPGVKLAAVTCSPTNSPVSDEIAVSEVPMAVVAVKVKLPKVIMPDAWIGACCTVAPTDGRVVPIAVLNCASVAAKISCEEYANLESSFLVILRRLISIEHSKRRF